LFFETQCSFISEALITLLKKVENWRQSEYSGSVHLSADATSSGWRALSTVSWSHYHF